MTAGSQRAALEAVHAARPIVARLGATRNSEDLAADLIEAWGTVETGLRSLIGGSAMGGQQLIRELRQRHFLTLEQANALAEFSAARERAARPGYAPTEGDVNAARDAFLKLEAGLMGEPAPHVAPASTTASAAAALAAANEPLGRRTNFTDAPPVVVALPATARPAWLMPVLGLLALFVVGALAWWALAGRGGNADYERGVQAYREGRRETAEGSFIKAGRDNPKDPMPHVYLARLYREAGNLNTANSEAVKAVELGPTNGAALRELASALFAQGNYDGARNFYVRALKVDAGDRLSQGYLGCSLVRMGRVQEGATWIRRAGTGSWQGCVAPQAPVGAAPTVPMTSPRP